MTRFVKPEQPIYKCDRCKIEMEDKTGLMTYGVKLMRQSQILYSWDLCGTCYGHIEKSLNGSHQ